LRLLVNSGKCTGCKLCMLVCSLWHEGICNPTKSRICVERRSVELDLPHVCRQCEKPPCVAACPLGALSKTADGSVRVDESACTACGFCAAACPFDAIRIHPSNRVAMICDLCGGDPRCVKYCALGALKVG